MTRFTDLPPWMADHVQKCRDAFGIGGDFPVQIDLRDELSGNPARGGETETDHRYMTALIRLRRDLDPDGYGPTIVTHEVLHAAQWHQFGAFYRILDLVPAALRQHATDLWDDANERYTEQMARALTPLLQAMTPAPTETPE